MSVNYGVIIMKSKIKGKMYEIRVKAKENSAENLLNDAVDSIRQKQKEFEKSISDYSLTQKPLTDIIETSDALIIKMDLPDVNKEYLEVNIGEDSVDIKAEFKEEITGEDIKFLKKERNYGTIMKSIPLPPQLKFKEATANFTNCILTIRVPKIPKKSYTLDVSDS